MYGLLNEALEDVYFTFHKKSEAELKLADSLYDQMRKTREAMARNIDPKDPEYVALLDELKRLFENRNVQAVTQAEMLEHIELLQNIESKVRKLNAENDRLALKFNGDAKFVRIFKQGVKEYGLQSKRAEFMEGLNKIKFNNDHFILNQGQAVQSNPSYFENESLRAVAKLKSDFGLLLDNTALKRLNQAIVGEYVG